MAETSAYQQLGVSATKEEVHAAVAGSDPGLFPGAFCRIGEDVLGGDPEWCCALHADDAGTKAMVAYLLYKETGSATVFRGIAQDALVMNLDDLLCIGATDRFLLSNTINRNSFKVGGDAVREIIQGYQDCIERLRPLGIQIVPTGGETADMVDGVRTIVVGANLATRLRRDQVVDNRRIAPGDVIVGLSSTGQASYEDQPNSGIGDNGLTLARHALLHHRYAEKYPETTSPEVDDTLVYRGPFALGDVPPDLGMAVGAALTSPTRTYAPIVRAVLRQLSRAVHGIVHNTGGGQTKCVQFGEGIRYVKDQLFPCPPLFRLLADVGSVSGREMAQTFNLGHRMELFVAVEAADAVIDLSARYGVEAKIVGRCERAAENSLHLVHTFGTFDYPRR